MNTNDNVFFSYSFGAVLIDDAPTATTTQPVVYWDETELDSTESNSPSKPRLCIARVGFNAAHYSQLCQSSMQQRAQIITRRLVA